MNQFRILLLIFCCCSIYELARSLICWTNGASRYTCEVIGIFRKLNLREILERIQMNTDGWPNTHKYTEKKVRCCTHAIQTLIKNQWILIAPQKHCELLTPFSLSLFLFFYFFSIYLVFVIFTSRPHLVHLSFTAALSNQYRLSSIV